MTDLQIDYFMAVARSSSFIKAAERLYVSQPAISRQVSTLETELGTLLFNRSKRASKLTPAGELFYKFFLDYKNSLATTRYRAQIVNEKIMGAFRLGYPEGWVLPDFFPKLLAVLQQQYPKIRISLYAWGLRELLEELQNGNLDLIIALNPAESFSVNFASQPITEIPHCLLYSTHLPQAKLKNPVLEDFKDHPFFVVDVYNSLMGGVRGILASHGVGHVNIVPVPNLETGLARVQYNQGVIIVNGWDRALQNRSFGALELDTLQKVSFAWQKKDANKFIQIFMAEFNKNIAPSLAVKAHKATEARPQAGSEPALAHRL
jgi:DNA-binding transcriptional LysR family regulator